MLVLVRAQGLRVLVLMHCLQLRRVHGSIVVQGDE